MDYIAGDKFVEDCARFIRFNEAKLSRSTTTSSSSAAGTSFANPVSWLFAAVPAPSPSPSAASPSSSSSSSTAAARSHNIPRVVVRPTPLRLTSHHLYYLLIRFESLGLITGPLDVQIPSTSRPSSYFAFISNNAAGSGFRKKDRDDAMSISSLQTTMSALTMFGTRRNGGESTSTFTSWWKGGGSHKADISIDVKYIYSAMTKIPALRIGPPPLKLIKDFEDCPGEISVPLDVFKNVQVLEFEDSDPRAFLGWDRLSMQLRSLSIRRSGVEDITDIIIDAVLQDGRRRRGERVRQRKRKIHAPTSIDEDEVSSSRAVAIQEERQQESTKTTTTTTKADSRSEAPAEVDDHSSESLPSLSWHFLRHLSLSDNSLTFLHSSCLSCLGSLTSLDLSNNLINAVPPSLELLPNLQSLNLANNLIESVIGIPQALPSIKALNLSSNRLESLCGLERLSTLIRIDLRKNEIYEAGEIGRLAILPSILEVYIAGNPVFEEVEDARVDVFVEFAKEGKNVERLKLDEESIGYFERQRLRERIPNMDALVARQEEEAAAASTAAAARRKQERGAENRAEGRGAGGAKEARTKNDIIIGSSSEPVVKTVRHRKNHSSSGAAKGGSDSYNNQSHNNSNSHKQRRNQRVVDLPEDGGITKEAGNDSGERKPNTFAEVSDSDVIKRAALAGDTDVAIGSIMRQATPSTSDALGPSSTSAAEEAKETTATAKVEEEESVPRRRIGRSQLSYLKKNGHGVEEESPDQHAAGRRGGEAAALSTSSLSAATGSNHTTSKNPNEDHDLRKKIEALKGEIGDDWLRVLARGESIYVPKRSDGAEEEENDEDDDDDDDD